MMTLSWCSLGPFAEEAVIFHDGPGQSPLHLYGTLSLLCWLAMSLLVVQQLEIERFGLELLAPLALSLPVLLALVLLNPSCFLCQSCLAVDSQVAGDGAVPAGGLITSSAEIQERASRKYIAPTLTEATFHNDANANISKNSIHTSQTFYI